MAANTGNYTRAGNPEAMFDEQNLYLQLLQQSGKAAVDADFNDAAFSMVAQMRRLIQNTIGDRTPNNGFRIDQSGVTTTNNLTIKGGDGTNEGAGRIFVSGFPCMLKDDVEYSDGSADVNQRRLMPQITGVPSALILVDSTANWTVDEHAGKTLTPDVDIPATTFTILSNTATQITVTAGDLAAATSPQKFYRIELSTPSGGARTDEVYLDVFIDEQDEVEDPNFIHTDLTPDQAAANRLVLRQFIRVKEGAATPAGHTDLDGRAHFTLKIATINRLDADATITTAMLVDERNAFVPGTSVLRVTEFDLAPSVDGIAEIRFPNDAVVDLGGGVVTVTPLKVQEQDAAPTVQTNTLKFANGLLTDEGGGVVSVAPMTVQEQDASPSVQATVLKFPNDTLTDEGSGVVSFAEILLSIQEEDASPTILATTLKFPNNSLTDEGGGVALLDRGFTRSLGLVSVDAKVVAETTIFTVPAGKEARIWGVWLKCTAAAAITSGAEVGIGVAGGADDIVAQQKLLGVLAVNDSYRLMPFGKTIVAAAGAAIKVGIDVVPTGTSQTLEFDLIGYLK